MVNVALSMGESQYQTCIGQVSIIFSKCSTPKPALLLTYLLITMESLFPIVLTLQGGANTSTSGKKFLQ